MGPGEKRLPGPDRTRSDMTTISTPLQPGDRLQDRYIVARVHRLSGTGALYEVEEPEAGDDNKRLAIKEELLTASEEALPDALQAFEERAKVLMQLDHPTIPRMLDAFVLGERTFLITDFINGHDLESALSDSRGGLPVKTIYLWALTLCDVLDYLHSHTPHPIIYRDLKPANLMLDEKEKLWLVDFGIAMVMPEGPVPFPLGTDGYAAPEQYDGVVSPAIDIYALGATLHHLLTGCDPRLEPPFTFDKRPIHQLSPAVPKALAEIVTRALSDDPAGRFASVAEMQAELEAIRDQID